MLLLEHFLVCACCTHTAKGRDFKSTTGSCKLQKCFFLAENRSLLTSHSPQDLTSCSDFLTIHPHTCVIWHVMLPVMS